jgi:hypothetical protein
MRGWRNRISMNRFEWRDSIMGEIDQVWRRLSFAQSSQMPIGNLIYRYMLTCPRCGSVYLVPPKPSHDSGNAEPISAAITLDHFAGIPQHRFRVECSTSTFMMDVLMHSAETTLAHERVVCHVSRM